MSIYIYTHIYVRMYVCACPFSFMSSKIELKKFKKNQQEYHIPALTEINSCIQACGTQPWTGKLHKHLEL